MGETEGVYTPEGAERQRTSNALLEDMVTILMQGADDPPTRPHGMPEEYFDGESRLPSFRFECLELTLLDYCRARQSTQEAIEEE